MSLWEKWEKEKLKKQGIEVERESNVEIRDTRPKPNLRRQFLILSGAILACLLAVYAAMLLDDRFGGFWADTYIISFIAETERWRQSLPGRQ